MILRNRKFDLFLAWCSLVLYADFIFVMSSMERMPFPLELKFHSDWLVHGVEYAVLGVLLARTLHLTWRFRFSDTLVLACAALGALYGLTDEWHQSFVPHRAGSLADVAADGIGAWAGSYLWVAWQKKPKKKA